MVRLKREALRLKLKAITGSCHMRRHRRTGGEPCGRPSLSQVALSMRIAGFFFTGAAIEFGLLVPLRL
jgi:hypothetical protein